MQQASRHDLARALAPRYAHASRREQGQLLDEFCALTGYTRKHALVLLRHPPAEQRVANRRGRPPSYGPAEVVLLRVCWAATDGICSKRLAPWLPELRQRLRHWPALQQVSAETIERVAHLSPATIDRALASSRDGLPTRGLSTTRPGTLLKPQVVIKTFADWTETVPDCASSLRRLDLMGGLLRELGQFEVLDDAPPGGKREIGHGCGELVTVGAAPGEAGQHTRPVWLDSRDERQVVRGARALRANRQACDDDLDAVRHDQGLRWLAYLAYQVGRCDAERLGKLATALA